MSPRRKSSSQTVIFEPFAVLLFAIISVRESWHASGRGVRCEKTISSLFPFGLSGRSDRIASRLRVEQQDSMVRSARILRVTRVAARLDCLQRLSNAQVVREKQTRCGQLMQNKPLFIMRLCIRSAASEFYAGMFDIPSRKLHLIILISLMI